MTDGWRCPGCSRCYAPSVTECRACGQPTAQPPGGLEWMNNPLWRRTFTPNPPEQPPCTYTWITKASDLGRT